MITTLDKPKRCLKIDICAKIQMVMDKEIHWELLAETIEKVCNKCDEYEGEK